MKYRVVFRTTARDEALDAAAYITEHGSVKSSRRWLRDLETAIESLTVMPLRCGVAREHVLFPGVDLRQLVCHSHRLIFLVRDDTVHVLHIRHVRQDLTESIDPI